MNLRKKGQTYREIAEFLDTSTETIRKIVGIMQPDKIPNNKYQHDAFYFKEIDSEQKAYYLGFISADGNVSGNSLAIQIQMRDKHILESFVSDIKFTGPIADRSKKNRDGGTTTYATLVITGQQLVNDLAKWGVVPQKTGKLYRIPDIREDLVRHYLRGYYDGDGSIKKLIQKGSNPLSKKTQIVLVSACEEFLIRVRDYYKTIGVESEPKLDRSKDKITKQVQDVWTLSYGGYCHIPDNAIQKIADHLYKDSKVHLERKYQRYLEVKACLDLNIPSRKEQKQQQHGNKIYRVEDNKIYPSISEAARDVGSRVGNLQTALRNPHRTCKGFHWKYVEDKQ
jgi:intein/homing endonuclease